MTSAIITTITDDLSTALEQFIAAPIDDRTISDVRDVVDAILIAHLDNGHVSVFDTEVDGFPDENSVVVTVTIKEYPSSDAYSYGVLVCNGEEDATVELVTEANSSHYSWYDDLRMKWDDAF